MKNIFAKTISSIAVCVYFLVSAADAQTTEFTYSGRLTDSSLSANGTYQMQFSLHSTVSSTGDQIGATLVFDGIAPNPPAVQVSSGVFSVTLNFTSANAYDGSPRWLEIAVKRPADPSYVTLSPRQQITSTPYAVKSLKSGTSDVATNAQQLGGVAANQYVVTTDSRMSDARPPAAGSANYVQNTSSLQSSSNFNISGNGTVGGALNANIVNSATQYNLGGVRMFTTSGADNFGPNVFTAVNSFIGDKAGLNTVPNPTPGNSLGKWNSFFGVGAGQANIQGADNSFFGALTGLVNAGGENSFFGSQAGISNTDGILNTFVGWQSGYSNVQGNTNTFIGVGTDFNSSNSTGNGNTLLGIRARVDSGVSNGTAIGGRALVTQSNSLVLGSINGVNLANADTNVGIGTTAPTERLHVVGNGVINGDLTVTGTLNANLPTNNGSYIQNTTTQQPTSNFNISGNGILAGKLGIGSTNPTYKVETLLGANNYGYVHTDGTRTLGTYTNSFENSGMIGTITNHPFQIYTSNAGPVITFTAGGSANGKVGIGTNSPVGNLHINVPSSGSPINALTVDVQSFQTPANAINSYFFKARDVGSGSAPAFLIRGDGNVGIGTSTPAEKLTVVGNALIGGTISGNGSGLTNIGSNNLSGVPNSPGAGVPFIIRYLANGSGSAQVIYNHSSSPAPRNFLIIDVWSINTASNNSGQNFTWSLQKSTICAGGANEMAFVSFPQNTVGNGGIFGRITRVEYFNTRLFTASTDDLVVCFANTYQMEVNILAVPLN